jgi:two-component system, sensor histidine kinase
VSPPHASEDTETIAKAAGDILIVDDNPGNLLAIEAALGDLAGNLVKARSGEEALRRLLEQDFALVLLDVQMPGMDGFETARLIRSRERSRRVPIIFVTAFTQDDEDTLTGYALGAVDFLFKPIRAEVLRAKASVFVELQRHTAEVARQAELLREHERREHERRLLEEKQKWEAEALRRQMDEQRRVAEEMARKAEELARTVAEREHAERELTKINRQLEEADRRKDEFLAVLAHELRNPLAPILAGLELFRTQDVHDNPLLVRARDAMDRQVRHLVRLVDDLLDISRITSGKIELRTCRVSLQSAISQAEHMTRSLIEERRHRLDIEAPDQPVWLMADPVRLAQIIANLLTNAARYTPPQGRIAVTYAIEGDQAVVRVSDNGRGIPPELVGKVFDMFVQAKHGSDGLGLGLSLVQRLVELHHGRVEVRSAGEGKGSEFTIWLPVAPESREHAGEAPAEEAHAEASEQPLRVVLIDDEADIRETVRALLELWGHRVEVAPSGYQGVDLLLRVQPDVALVDIGLPDIDGYGVAERVCAALGERRPRLVAMSGYGQEKDRARAREAGFDAHITKPATADVLRRVLSET